jgi:hypothetical protein
MKHWGKIVVSMVLGIGVLSALFFAPLSDLIHDPRKTRLLRSVANAKQLCIAIQQEEQDRAQSNSGIGLPRESGAQTTGEYLALLVREGYLKPSDLSLADGLVIANASVVDPPDTVLIVSRSVYDAALRHASALPVDWIVLDKQGHGISSARLPFPPRDPPFLAP